MLIAFISFYLFRFLHVWVNHKISKSNPSIVHKYPWLFTSKSHSYVFAVMLLKLSAVLVMIWVDLVGVPNFLER